MAKPSGIHLVGSFPAASEEEVFRKVFPTFSNRLATVPDGETGVRHYFVRWQTAAWPEQVLLPVFRTSSIPEDPDFQLEPKHVQPTKYDEAAIASYQTFRKLREEGVIPAQTRFQVCLPGVWNSLALIHRKYHAQAFPLYFERLRQAVDQIQKHIPAADLAIQIDLAVEIGVIEHSRGYLQDAGFDMWHEGDAQETIIRKTLELARLIDPAVPLGFHLCYGDRGHQHFVQPKDLGVLVEVTNALVLGLKPTRGIDWVHLPVPRDRTDAAYFKPLRTLNASLIKLFLGLIHPHDREGTEERIRAAQAAYGEFGVSTECGFGRTSPSDVESILDILLAVSSPA